ncbi:MAG: ABC transporter ATP-binding protein [Chloroflexota bacterium]
MPGTNFSGGVMKPVVVVDDIRIEYADPEGRRFTAVDGVAFEVREGEKFIIIGPSGCGKTTLLRAIAGFVMPSRGRVLVAGEPVREPGPDRAVVFQEFDQLFPWRTVLDNVVYALKVTGRARGRTAVEQAHHFLRLVGIEAAADKYPHQLSGGMKQRAAIARALAIGPKILLMDEPFGALDAITRTQLQQELNRIWAETGVTIILVTHSIQEAAYLGHRVLVMAANPGRVQAIVNTEHVDDMDSEAFAEATRRLRRLLGGEAEARAVREEGAK